jgi:hypothetical protein
MMPNSDDRWHGRGGGGVGGKTVGAGGQQPNNPGPGWVYPLCPLLYCKVPTYDTILLSSWNFEFGKNAFAKFLAEENQLLDLVYQIYRISSHLEVIFKSLESAIKNILVRILLGTKGKFNKFSENSLCPLLLCKVLPIVPTTQYFNVSIVFLKSRVRPKTPLPDFW